MQPEPDARSLTKPVVGLIGGIGSGKSVVASMLEEMGGCIIDADRFGHEALRQPDIALQVVKRWGIRVLDESGAIQRRRLASIVFADANERRALEAMVFPWIEQRIHEELVKAQHDPSVSLIVLDAAILLEKGWGRVCDRLVFVSAPREQRLARVASNRGWSAKEVEAREAAQMPLDEKRAHAHTVIENDGDRARTRLQVERLAMELRQSHPSTN
jgi:dephospho-CoA kinase